MGNGLNKKSVGFRNLDLSDRYKPNYKAQWLKSRTTPTVFYFVLCALRIMSESVVLQSMRLMAWERAKGELNSISQSIYPGMLDKEHEQRLDKFNQMLDDFIRMVEDEGLIEGT